MPGAAVGTSSMLIDGQIRSRLFHSGGLKKRHPSLRLESRAFSKLWDTPGTGMA